MGNKYELSLLSFWRRAVLLGGLLLIASGGFYFFNVPAKTQTAEAPGVQNLTNGRLAFGVRYFGQGYYFAWIYTSNPDGSGAGSIQAQGYATQPAWSPDGTKIAWVGIEDTPRDIFVCNIGGSGHTNLTNTPATETNPSWSVTGKIAYERDSQIWTMNADGSNQAQFTAITQPSPSGPAWSPDGGKLAFANSTGIWVINADGTNERRVTTSGTDPAWSPDGTKIVFARGYIAVINADGTNETPINPGINDEQPAWSPDGTKLAVRGSGGIYTMDPDGGNRVRIFADRFEYPTISMPAFYPAWQPTAQTPNTFTISGRITQGNASQAGTIVNLSGTINAATTTDAVGNYQFSNLAPGGSYTVSPSRLNNVFTPPSRRFNNLDSNKIANFSASRVCIGLVCASNGKIAFVRHEPIFTMNHDGIGIMNIGAGTEPDWSPDGTRIAFTTNRDGNKEIYRMNADGSGPVRLTNNPASDSAPYYSRDGASIVFVSDRDGNSEIYKMNADGTNQVRLTNDAGSDGSPAFSPNGQKIIFTTTRGGGALFTMNADGSNQQAITNIPGSYYRPSYSPDGTKIIFGFISPGGFGQRILTMNADGTNRAEFLDGRDAAYSPDGTRIVFISGIDINSQVSVINSDLSWSRVLTTSYDRYSFPDWQPLPAARRVLFDFDGDGRSDVSVFRPSNRFWYLQRSQAGFAAYQFGLSDDVLAPADYDGDLKTDVAVWRPSNGNFYILNSFDGTVRIENFGLAGDIPAGGDFDGDGKAEVAVYREGAQSTFYYRASMGNPNRNMTVVPWGKTNDKPVAGDYDGDGRTDAAVFRPSNGTWYVRRSSDAGLTALNWGLASDRVVPADYDADGKTDFAVFRNGVWYLQRTTQGLAVIRFGTTNDVPAPADFDGDGKADLAIFRDGVWWILKSQSGMAEAVQFGLGSDKPVPSAYVR